MSTDTRVDRYIADAADFAQPLLQHWRAFVHQHCAGATETIKWGMPFFLWQGKILCHMAAFKAHASVSFWRDPSRRDTGEREGMGGLGRLRALSDFPPAAELARRLDESRARAEGTASDAAASPAQRGAKAARAEPVCPDDLQQALNAAPASQRFFQQMPPSHRREYIAWITEAKRAETRSKRLAQTLEWLAEGKHRNWKYENC